MYQLGSSERARLSSFEGVRLVELPGAGHHYGFRRDAFEQAFDALEPATR